MAALQLQGYSLLEANAAALPQFLAIGIDSDPALLQDHDLGLQDLDRRNAYVLQ